MRLFRICSKFFPLFLLSATAMASSAVPIFVTLASFGGSDMAWGPQTSLVQGIDGNLYGTTWGGGGPNNWGTVFRATRDGQITTIHSFCGSNCEGGGNPDSALVLGEDGDFYGTTFNGGTYGYGTIYRIAPSGEFQTLHSFCSQRDCIDGGSPSTALVSAADGFFYGTAWYGQYGHGIILRISPDGNFLVLSSFCGQPGCVIAGDIPLIQASDGKLYGGGWGGDGNCPFHYNCGTIFRVSPSGEPEMLYSFSGIDGMGVTGLLQGLDGNLYGTTVGGGPRDPTGVDYLGTVFKFSRGGKRTTIANSCWLAPSSCFGINGAGPVGGIIQATDGNFYGVTVHGGDGLPGGGTVFEINSERGIRVHWFNNVGQYGPQGGLVQATNGLLYGTTRLGGDFNFGTLFSVDVGLSPFIAFIRDSGSIGQSGGILGQGFTGTTSVDLNGVPANFTVVSDTYIRATVPAGAKTGYVTVTTPSGVLKSNVPFRVIR